MRLPARENRLDPDVSRGGRDHFPDVRWRGRARSRSRPGARTGRESRGSPQAPWPRRAPRPIAGGQPPPVGLDQHCHWWPRESVSPSGRPPMAQNITKPGSETVGRDRPESEQTDFRLPAPAGPAASSSETSRPSDSSSTNPCRLFHAHPRSGWLFRRGRTKRLIRADHFTPAIFGLPVATHHPSAVAKKRRVSVGIRRSPTAAPS